MKLRPEHRNDWCDWGTCRLEWQTRVSQLATELNPCRDVLLCDEHLRTFLDLVSAERARKKAETAELGRQP